MMQDRWEGNVHYYDYTPDSIRRWSNRDAFIVAEAFVYSEDEQYYLGRSSLFFGVKTPTA